MDCPYEQTDEQKKRWTNIQYNAKKMDKWWHIFNEWIVSSFVIQFAAIFTICSHIYILFLILKNQSLRGMILNLFEWDKGD